MTTHDFVERTSCDECGLESAIPKGAESVKCPKGCGEVKSKMVYEEEPGSEHYRALPVEPIEVTKHMGFLDGNVVKYVMRFKTKGGLKDLQKARQYLKWLIEKEYPDDG